MDYDNLMWYEVLRVYVIKYISEYFNSETILSNKEIINNIKKHWTADWRSANTPWCYVIVWYDANNLEKKFYIGKSVNPAKRIMQHASDRSGYKIRNIKKTSHTTKVFVLLTENEDIAKNMEFCLQFMLTPYWITAYPSKFFPVCTFSTVNRNIEKENLPYIQRTDKKQKEIQDMIAEIELCLQKTIFSAPKYKVWSTNYVLYHSFLHYLLMRDFFVQHLWDSIGAEWSRKAFKIIKKRHPQRFDIETDYSIEYIKHHIEGENNLMQKNFDKTKAIFSYINT